jgi:hypothetical protein
VVAEQLDEKAAVGHSTVEDLLKEGKAPEPVPKLQEQEGVAQAWQLVVVADDAV